MTGKLMVSRRVLPLVAGLISLGAMRAEAQTWVDWTAVLAGTPGSAKGNLPLASGNVGVTYNGEVRGASSTSTGSSAGTYFDPAAYPAAYTSATAPIGPTNNGWIQLIGPSQGNVLTFTEPVNRLYFAIMSLGQAGVNVSYVFSQPFVILSQGPAAFGGCGTCLVQSAPNVITGIEGDGVLMFTGPVSTLSFSIAGEENFHGFTVGVDAVTSTPEPASLALLGTGLVGVFGAARLRRRKKDA